MKLRMTFHIYQYPKGIHVEFAELHHWLRVINKAETKQVTFFHAAGKPISHFITYSDKMKNFLGI